MRSSRLVTALRYGVATALALLFLLPFYVIVRNAFSTNQNITAPRWNWLPDQLNLTNLDSMLSSDSTGVLRGLLNSAIMTILQTVGTVVVSLMAGYGLARFTHRLSRMVLGLTVFTTVPHPGVHPIESATPQHLDRLVDVGDDVVHRHLVLNCDTSGVFNESGRQIKTRHAGIESSFGYRLDELMPALKGTEVYGNYAYVDASIREEGPNKGNQVPFSSKHKGLLGIIYTQDAWQAGFEGEFQSSQYADNANTVAESADGSTGRIPGYGTWNLRGSYDFGPSLHHLKIGAGIKNIFGREFYTRSYDDNNKGKYLGQPRTVYVQASIRF